MNHKNQNESQNQIHYEFGRYVRDDKRCFIAHDSAKKNEQLGISPDTWIDELIRFKSVGFSTVGTATLLIDFTIKTKKKWSLLATTSSVNSPPKPLCISNFYQCRFPISFLKTYNAITTFTDS